MTTNRDRVYRTEAVVLRRQDVGEADRLLTLYTPKMGKLRVIAKGVRKPASRKAGHLELFIHSELLIAKGQNLDIVTQAETIHAFLPLRNDLERITCGHYVIELLDRFAAEDQANQALFDLLIDTLQRVGESDNLALAVRFYELHLLALEGYRPQLFYCLGCGDLLQPTVNYFSAEQGGMLCPRCGKELLGPAGAARAARPVSVNVLKVLRYLQNHDAQAASRLRLQADTQRELEGLMLHYITYVLERNLKSVELMRLLNK